MAAVPSTTEFIFSARAMRRVLHENHALQSGRGCARKSPGGCEIDRHATGAASTDPTSSDARARSQIGSPIRAELWNAGDNKRIDLTRSVNYGGDSYNASAGLRHKPTTGTGVMGWKQVGEPKQSSPRRRPEPQAPGSCRRIRTRRNSFLRRADGHLDHSGPARPIYEVLLPKA